MTDHSLAGRAADFVHRNFLWLLAGCYLVAALFPAFGLVLRDISLGEFSFGTSHTRVSLSMAMLSMLLFNAGLGVDARQLSALVKAPWTLLAGLAANLLVPIAFIFGLSQTMRLWHNPDEVQNILVGLALVVSMPIAGSSTAWSQNASGNMALSLGLVLFSTLLSPLTTPIALHAVELLTVGEYADGLHQLASGGTNAFLALAVIGPSFTGVALRFLLRGMAISRGKTYLKLVNSLVLFLLIYSNASLSLPQAVRMPDYDFLAVMLFIATALCAAAFGAGWLLAKLLKAGPAERIALMFGLGMNNNGAGLVLASLALADHPRAMLPLIFYNLVQHLVAGGVDRIIQRERPEKAVIAVAHQPATQPGTGRAGEAEVRAVAPLSVRLT